MSLALTHPELYPDLQELFTLPLPEVEEFNRRLKLEKELEYAGFYITEHPIDEYAHLLINEGVEDIALLVESGDSDGLEEESDSVVVNSLSPEDVTDEMEGTLGARAYEDGDFVKVAGVIKGLTIKYSSTDQKPLRFSS